MEISKNVNSRVVVALDVENASRARAIVNALGSRGQVYKVGLQLLTVAGPDLICELVASGKQVFLDLKLFEIPNSVAGAVKAAGELGVSMVTVHASGGSSIMRAAVDAARAFPNMRVLALTVVTSLRDQDLREIGIEVSVADQVLRLARLADAAGCHGVVASPHEVALLRGVLRPGMLILTPGIQLANELATDQARVATPGEAFRAGANYIMIGRSITEAEDCRAVFDSICSEATGAIA